MFKQKISYFNPVKQNFKKKDSESENENFRTEFSEKLENNLQKFERFVMIFFSFHHEFSKQKPNFVFE